MDIVFLAPEAQELHSFLNRPTVLGGVSRLPRVPLILGISFSFGVFFRYCHDLEEAVSSPG